MGSLLIDRDRARVNSMLGGTMRAQLVLSFAGIAMLASGPARGSVTFTNIADTNTTALGQSVKFNSQFHNPSISGNDLSFLGFYSGGFGEYTATVKPVANFKLIDTGDN